jgi:hypothetical protein
VKKRFYVAAPDATPQQIAIGGYYRSAEQAQAAADEWNAKHPDLPVVVWQPK